MSPGTTQRLAVLAYHKVGAAPAGSWATWFSVSEAAFVEQLSLLADTGWEAVGVDTLLAGLRERRRLPDRAVLLTFDDGYRTLCGAALEALRRFGFPAIVFVPTDFVGRCDHWNDDSDEPVEALCGWDELSRLDEAGVSVQSHGASHRSFSRLDPDKVTAELTTSKRELEAALGRAVELFAYPYGDRGSDGVAERELARAGYRCAFGYGGAPNDIPVPNEYCLARIAMGADTDLEAELAR
jgi:peptidoglycan/xylan/chitin deacetylase (PgdA/CDA1 family)